MDAKEPSSTPEWWVIGYGMDKKTVAGSMEHPKLGTCVGPIG